jgi:hypothetical protein
MTLGLTTVTATSALRRETPTKETPETAETHVEKRLKRLWVRIGETLKRLRLTSAGRWWLVWVSGGRKGMMGSSKATNVACLAVFDPDTNSALSRQLEIGIFCVEVQFCLRVVDIQEYGAIHTRQQRCSDRSLWPQHVQRISASLILQSFLSV